LLAILMEDTARSPYKAVCSSNLKQLALGMRMYAQDYDERMPPAGGWQPGVYPYTKTTSILTCPARPKVTPGYAFNQLLDGRPLKKIAAPALTSMLFESRLAVANASDRMESFVRPHGEHKQGNIAFTDMHVKSFETPPRAADGISSRKK
jgi:hypothetical protein